jgi:cobyrinic acid a,c-diamide synthase
LIIAAPASGSGKTLVTAALLRCLRQRGVRVIAAKAGPDYIDPDFHRLASGRPCANLDCWAMQPSTLAAAVASFDGCAELVLCEGVMGLFDGTGSDGETGSTAELAQITGWPVVLVVDAHGQGASVAALLRGFVGHRPDISIAGVIFNRISSERHGALLAAAVARYFPEFAVLGGLAADPALMLPSRHLGLVPASENAGAEAIIERAASRIGPSIDVDGLRRLARPSKLRGEVQASGIPPLGQRIAVARDDAFCFAYPYVLDSWRNAGAELRFFSPLANQPPDPAADAVYLPGGYPELWAARLNAADHFRDGLQHAAADGKPIYGECGGYMVLGRTLIDDAGCGHEMAGLLPLETSFRKRRLHIGYRNAALLAATVLGRAGAGFRGHEFHYATIVHEGAAKPLWALRDAAGADLGHGGSRCGSVFGSFVHLIDSWSALGVAEIPAAPLKSPGSAKGDRLSP